MSGATVAYNLRQNKSVERQLFIELLRFWERWKSLRNHLYIGFGGVYFEDYKLLHGAFGIDKMISLEVEPWMLARQQRNIPFGCIEPRHQSSAEFIAQVEEHRRNYNVDNMLIWLDYAKPKDLVNQLTEIKSLIPNLVEGDILKCTLSLHTAWLEDKCAYYLRFQKRMDKLKAVLGSSFLPDGITPQSVNDDNLPRFYLATLRRAILGAMTESPELEFVPMGTYEYSDGTRMLTLTGAIVSKAKLSEFTGVTRIEELELGGPDWENLFTIRVPDLSLRERFLLDESIYTPQSGMPAATCDPPEVAAKLGFQFTASADESLRMIESYMALYRHYPNYQRVLL